MEGRKPAGADTVTPVMKAREERDQRRISDEEGKGRRATHRARRGRIWKRSAWQRHGSYVDDGQNY